MTTTPPTAPPPPPPADSGPRVSSDEMRDLARLRRSRTDRKVAGVAGGLARHLDVDPLVLRVVFVVLAFFGGAGLILYGAAWLLVPDEGTDKAPIHLDDRTRTVVLLVVAGVAGLALVGDSWGAFWFPWPVTIIALAALWLVTRNNQTPAGYVPPPTPGQPAYAAPPASPTTPTAPASPYDAPVATPPTAPFPVQHPAAYAASSTAPYPTPPYPTPAYPTPAYPPPRPRRRGPLLFLVALPLIALAEGALGIADLAGAPVADAAYPALAVAICGALLVLGAFYGRAGGIIALGVVASIALAATTAAHEVDHESVTERPAVAADVDSRYSLGVGEQRIDLSRVADPAALDGRTIAIDGDVGSIDVTVPSGVRVAVDARVDGPGEIKLFGAQRNGWGVSDSAAAGDPAGPSITLDVDLSVGTIEVTY